MLLVACGQLQANPPVGAESLDALGRCVHEGARSGRAGELSRCLGEEQRGALFRSLLAASGMISGVMRTMPGIPSDRTIYAVDRDRQDPPAREFLGLVQRLGIDLDALDFDHPAGSARELARYWLRRAGPDPDRSITELDAFQRRHPSRGVTLDPLLAQLAQLPAFRVESQRDDRAELRAGDLLFRATREHGRWTMADVLKYPPHVPRTVDATERRLRRRALAGDAQAQFDLALLRMPAELTLDHEAARWMMAAADNGHARAQYEMASIYHDADPRDGFAIAADLFRRAAAGGHGEAYWALGRFIAPRTDASATASVEHFRRGADLGDPKSMAELGTAHLLGRGVAADADAGLALLRRAASLGLADADHRLGIAFHQGEVVPRDVTMACRHWLRGARAGHADSQFGAAICSAEIEHASSLDRVVFWATLAADQGHREAALTLERLRAEGADAAAVARLQRAARAWRATPDTTAWAGFTQFVPPPP